MAALTPPRAPAHAVRVAFAILCSILWIAPTARAQRDGKPPKKIDEKWREDPYTADDPEILKSAGYECIDRIGWTEAYDSQRIEQALGRVKIRWIETAHFRLGCELPKWKVPGDDKKAKLRVRDELKQLRALGLKIKGSPKSIDPWLRTHLYALRLEALFRDFTTLVDAGLDEDQRLQFGTKPKFRVMMLNGESGCARFIQTFSRGSEGKSPMRWSDMRDGGYNFATAIGYAPESYGDDTALYCHLASHMTHTFLNAFFSGRAGPGTSIWWREGYAHSVRRRIADDHNGFTSIAERSEHSFSATDWERRVLKMLKSKILRPFEEIATIGNYGDLTLRDHMQIWSRVEFLRHRDDEKFGAFIRQVTRQSSQEDALSELFGLDASQFDEEWMRWLKKEYRDA